MHAQPQDGAVGGQRQLDVSLHVAPVRGAEEFFTALARPGHRAAGGARGQGDDHVLGVGAGLHAKAAADVGHAHAHLLGFGLQGLGHGRAHAGGHLRAEVHLHAAIRIGPGAYCARLDRQRSQALVRDVELDHVRRALKGRRAGRRIAVARLAGQVVGCVGQHARRAVQRRGQSGHRRQFFVVDPHGLGGVLGLLQSVGHHGGHRLADKAHHLVRQRRALRRGAGAAVSARERHARGHGRHALRGQLGAGQDGAHAGQLFGLGRVHAADRRVRVRRPHEHQTAVARLAQIVGVAALALEERVVLHAQNGVAATEAGDGGVCGHGVSLAE